MSAPPTIILRIAEVRRRTGLSRSTIYARITPDPRRPREYDPTFPVPIRLGARAVGWIAAEVDAWVAARVAETRCPPASPTAPTPRRPAPPRRPRAVPVIEPEGV